MLLLAVTGLLAACSSSKPAARGPVVDPGIAQHVSSARAAYEAGAYGRAAKFYGQALARARSLDDAAEIGRNAYNAAACHLRAGSPAAALPLLVEAEREFRASGQSIQPVLVLRARAQAALGATEASLAASSNAVAVSTNDAEQFSALVDRFDAALRSGDLAAAEKELKRLERRRSSVPGAAGEAPLAEARARLAEKRNRPADAAGAYVAAAAARRSLGDLRQMSDAWANAGRCASDAGKPGDAAEFHYRAARSRFGRNELVPALESIGEALKAVDVAKDESLHDQIVALLGEIKKAVDGGVE